MASGASPAVLPTVTRVGFDHGWLCLSRCFLNLGSPVLLVDRLLLGLEDGYSLGLELFGLRNPRYALPETRIRIEFHVGHLVALCADRHPEPPVLLAWHQYNVSCSAWQGAAEGDGPIVLMIGNTYAVENNWAALWECYIGLAGSVNLAFQVNRAAA